MATTLRAEDARQSLITHVEAKGIEAFVKFGPVIGWGELQHLLADRTIVRYPCEIAFDSLKLLPGEFAHPEQNGERPEEGFTMYVHPRFALELNQVAPLVLYQLVAVNYGEFAAFEEAETFGAAALGLTRDEYYAMLCSASERLENASTADDASGSGHCSGEPRCSCGS